MLFPWFLLTLNNPLQLPLSLRQNSLNSTFRTSNSFCIDPSHFNSNLRFLSSPSLINSTFSSSPATASFFHTLILPTQFVFPPEFRKSLNLLSPGGGSFLLQGYSPFYSPTPPTCCTTTPARAHTHTHKPPTHPKGLSSLNPEVSPSRAQNPRMRNVGDT